MTHQIPAATMVHGPSSLFALGCGSSLYLFSCSTGQQMELTGEKHTGIIRSINFNSKGSMFVSAGDDKSVKVWKHDKGHHWSCLSSRKIGKKTTAALFSHDDETVVFSDKFGDVYSFPAQSPSPSSSSSSTTTTTTSSSSPSSSSSSSTTTAADSATDKSNDKGKVKNKDTEGSQNIMGHYASITDMTMTPDGKYLITADKDEHIRVSHFPHAFDISCYCLSHKEFVSRIFTAHSLKDNLISGSGDGSLRLWNWTNGHLLDTVFIGPLPPADPVTVVPLAVSNHGLIAAHLEGSPKVLFYRAVNGKLEVKGSIDLPAVPVSCSFDQHNWIWVSSAKADQQGTHLSIITYSNEYEYTLLHPDVNPSLFKIMEQIGETTSSKVAASEYTNMLQELSKTAQYKKHAGA
eukprot:TRINITY_DN1115_c1_g1_i3.p1 TRINITY_DN1115_c1_g1~~TRINITY_DN1115_c1_g1_i3.p1  ORF type:complete len:405 (+),score=129.58 TRINITY_DN1115_c1_g1_i3:71-1285(+)